MTKSTRVALLGATLMLCASAQAAPAAQAVSASKRQATAASDLSARRYHRHERYAYGPYDPYPMYYGRPVYYAPKPFVPIPPLWGYGWEWW